MAGGSFSRLENLQLILSTFDRRHSSKSCRYVCKIALPRNDRKASWPGKNGAPGYLVDQPQCARRLWHAEVLVSGMAVRFGCLITTLVWESIFRVCRFRFVGEDAPGLIDRSAVAPRRLQKEVAFMTSVEDAGNQPEARDFVRVVRNADDIGEIADCWRAWCQHPAADMAWCLQEIRSSPEPMRPHVLVHYRGGQPNALLIGRCEMKRPDLRIGYFRIPISKVRCLTFPNGALVGDASATTCKSFIDTIRASLAAGEADAATIYQCELASPIATITRGHAAAGHSFGRRSKAKVLRTRMLIDEQNSSVIGLSAGERQHQKRRGKMLKELAGDAQIVCYRSETELDRLMKDAEAVAATTYQRGLRVGFVDTPQMRERLRFETRMGWLRAYVLYIAGRPCAFWICNLYRAVLFSCFLGFDPAYARYSPGAYLMLEVINRLGQEAGSVAVKQIDFGVGEAEYKARFGNRLEQVVSLFMFAPSISGVALGALHTAVEASNAAAARLLTASGLLSRLKRAWRSRLRPPPGMGAKPPSSAGRNRAGL